MPAFGPDALTEPPEGAESGNFRYTPGMSPVRIAGFALIGFACLFGVANIWYWMIDASGGGISLYDVWYKFSSGSLHFIQTTIQTYIWEALWNGIYIILLQPAWLVLGILGVILIGLGGRKVEE